MSTSVLSEPACTPTYEIVGAAGTPVILVMGGISATRHLTRSAVNPAPGWWEGVVGDGKVLDPAHRQILGIDWIDGGRGPDGRPERVVTTHDQAAAIVALLDELEVEQLDAVVGASYGGMVGLALAERWPERVRRLVVISAAHEAHTMSVAIRAIQRRIVELGLGTGQETEAMALARALAMTTYRTAGELAERFGVEPLAGKDGRVDFDVERYLMHSGAKFAARVSPARFLALSLSIDMHRVIPEQVQVRTTVIAAEGDTLVPASQTRELARRLPKLDARVMLRSRAGHDGFLVEPDRLALLLSTALAD
jgi:homoserine O-acetyltransferase